MPSARSLAMAAVWLLMMTTPALCPAEELESHCALEAGVACPDTLEFEGQCCEHAAVWCQDEQVQRIDCVARDQFCGVNPDEGWHTCVDSAPPDEAPTDGAACPDGLEFSGTCYGESVTWCNEANVVESLDCTEVGAICGFNEDEDYFDCLDPYPDIAIGDDCPDGLDSVGVCYGQLVRWCDENDQFQQLDCPSNNGVCGFNDDERYYDCLAPDQVLTSDEGGTAADDPRAATAAGCRAPNTNRVVGAGLLLGLVLCGACRRKKRSAGC